jgi:predicted phage terminase large subunit-like protein
VSHPTPLDPVALEASLCKRSFYHFVRRFWHEIIPEKPVWNWHIKYLCDEFQKDAELALADKPKQHDTIVNISPGTTKSTILSVMGPAWLHCRAPHYRVLCASHTFTLTCELGRKTRIVESCPRYRAMFPHVVPDKTTWSKTTFMNKAGGGRFSATVGGMTPTGFHAHFIIVDDPMDPQQARRLQQGSVSEANVFMSEVLPTRKVNKEVCPTWLIMQRLHQNDPSGFLIEKWRGKVRHICLPAELSPHVKPVKLRRKYKDGLMDPVRLSRKVLGDALTDLGDYGYAGQFLQNPVPKSGGMFKPERIEVEQSYPALTSKEWCGLCRFWDKAGTKDGGAFTVGLLMGLWRANGSPTDGSEDEWWVLDVVREQLDSNAREKLIVQTAKRDGKRVRIGIEKEGGSGGKESAEATLRRLAGYRAEAIPAVGSKEERADEWSCMVNGGAFKMPYAHWNNAFLDELRNFPRSTYKDQVDAGAGAFTILSNPEVVVGGMQGMREQRGRR